MLLGRKPRQRKSDLNIKSKNILKGVSSWQVLIDHNLQLNSEK